MADTSQGRFAWYDLMTTDQNAAVDFYTKVIGWRTSKFEVPGQPPYTMWQAGEAAETMIGGVDKVRPDMKGPRATPHWLAYVTVSDINATARQASELGAIILHGPTEIPTVGHFAVIADPQGAVIAPFQPAQPREPQPFAPQLRQFSWHELMTTDARAAFDFYAQLFGWEEISTADMGEMGPYLMYGQNGATYGGMFNPGPIPSPAWLYYVRIEDVNRAVERVKQNGGEVRIGPMEVPGGDTIAQCIDPQGAIFAVHQSKAGEDR